MSQASELLNNLTEEELAAYTTNSETEPHIVINDDRTITVPSELKKIGVQYDHNVETVTFDCPRYWDGLDMSTMIVYVNYKRADGYMGSYPADNVRISETDENIMNFEWTLSRNVTLVKGNISFLVCVKKTDENGNETNHWNSELNREMTVSEGLECNESVVEQYPDIITQLLIRMDSVEKVESKLLRPGIYYEVSPTLEVNSIYSVGVQDSLALNLPSGKVSDFIQVDFLSGDTPTTLTITSSNGLSEYDLVPEPNMIYSLYFDWGVLYYDSDLSEYIYGWRFNYAEYVVSEV